MGVKDGAKLLCPSRGHTHNLYEIRQSIQNKYPMDGPHPIVLVDVSILIVSSLTRNQSLAQFFLEPPIPVVAVSDSVKEYQTILIDANWHPVLVLDGATDPAKLDTYNKRRLKVPGAWADLQTLYASEPPTNNDQAHSENIYALGLMDENGDRRHRTQFFHSLHH